MKHNPRQLTAEIEASIRVFTREFFEERADWGAPDRDPIFVLGMPRAGSTLIEQILSSHPRSRGPRSFPRSRSSPRTSAAAAEFFTATCPSWDASARVDSARNISMGGAPAEDRPALLRRQDAEQLAPPAPDPAAASECEDHRRTPPCARLRILQLQAELRRDGVDLQLRPQQIGHHLPRICADDGAHRRRAPWPGSPGHPRATGGRYRNRGPANARLCRASVRSGLPSLPRDPAGGARLRVPSRCGSRSAGPASSNGRSSSNGSAPSRKRLGRSSTPIRRSRRVRPLDGSRAADGLRRWPHRHRSTKKKAAGNRFPAASFDRADCD